MKSILVPFYFLFCSALLPAQIKTGMTFQAVVYHDDGRLLALKPIGIRFSFIRDGTTLYSDTHRPTTTLNGLFSVIIGTGTPVIGSYENVPWELGSIRLKREYDVEGGTNYVVTGEDFFYTIPYAHVAQKSLEAPPAFAIDIHGQFLPTLKIGSIHWTATNLSVTHYRDGTIIPATDVFVYGDLEANAAKYGRLYSWNAVNSGKLCPEGWRIPTKSDWESLLAAYPGKSLKALAHGWTANADNASGFSALPVGIADGTGGYDGEGGYTYFWTGTEVSAGVAWSVGFFPDTDDAFLDNNLDKTFGLPVRCVR